VFTSWTAGTPNALFIAFLAIADEVQRKLAGAGLGPGGHGPEQVHRDEVLKARRGVGDGRPVVEVLQDLQPVLDRVEGRLHVFANHLVAIGLGPTSVERLVTGREGLRKAAQCFEGTPRDGGEFANRQRKEPVQEVPPGKAVAALDEQHLVVALEVGDKSGLEITSELFGTILCWSNIVYDFILVP